MAHETSSPIWSATPGTTESDSCAYAVLPRTRPITAPLIPSRTTETTASTTPAVGSTMLETAYIVKFIVAASNRPMIAAALSR